ncbi:MAG TPA: carboxymuconolactone decarboxylase family protein [Burkholderiales bacterium]|nr:carboxymuconolactone decarboxylase family protein [Burkholderiales bacterium]
MARVPYADENDSPEIKALAEKIRSERGGRMLNLYKMLLNSPPVADGWRQLFTAIRQKCELAGSYRELAILRVAIVNGAEYEYRAHVPFALKEGVTQAQIDVLDKWRDSGLFSDAQRAVLAYTDAMTRDIHVADAVFDALRLHFDQRQLVELTATIAGYNLVSRFLEALAIDPEAAHVRDR